MDDFFAILARRALGLEPAVTALVPPMFAPGPQVYEQTWPDPYGSVEWKDLNADGAQDDQQWGVDAESTLLPLYDGADVVPENAGAEDPGTSWERMQTHARRPNALEFGTSDTTRSITSDAPAAPAPGSRPNTINAPDQSGSFAGIDRDIVFPRNPASEEPRAIPAPPEDAPALPSDRRVAARSEETGEVSSEAQVKTGRDPAETASVELQGAKPRAIGQASPVSANTWSAEPAGDEPTSGASLTQAASVHVPADAQGSSIDRGREGGDARSFGDNSPANLSRFEGATGAPSAHDALNDESVFEASGKRTPLRHAITPAAGNPRPARGTLATGDADRDEKVRTQPEDMRGRDTTEVATVGTIEEPLGPAIVTLSLRESAEAPTGLAREREASVASERAATLSQNATARDETEEIQRYRIAAGHDGDDDDPTRRKSPGFRTADQLSQARVNDPVAGPRIPLAREPILPSTASVDGETSAAMAKPTETAHARQTTDESKSVIRVSPEPGTLPIDPEVRKAAEPSASLRADQSQGTGSSEQPENSLSGGDRSIRTPSATHEKFESPQTTHRRMDSDSAPDERPPIASASSPLPPVTIPASTVAPELRLIDQRKADAGGRDDRGGEHVLAQTKNSPASQPDGATAGTSQEIIPITPSAGTRGDGRNIASPEAFTATRSSWSNEQPHGTAGNDHSEAAALPGGIVGPIDVTKPRVIDTQGSATGSPARLGPGVPITGDRRRSEAPGQLVAPPSSAGSIESQRPSDEPNADGIGAPSRAQREPSQRDLARSQDQTRTGDPSSFRSKHDSLPAVLPRFAGQPGQKDLRADPGRREFIRWRDEPLPDQVEAGAMRLPDTVSGARDSATEAGSPPSSPTPVALGKTLDGGDDRKEQDSLSLRVSERAELPARMTSEITVEGNRIIEPIQPAIDAASITRLPASDRERNLTLDQFANQPAANSDRNADSTALPNVTSADPVLAHTRGRPGDLLAPATGAGVDGPPDVAPPGMGLTNTSVERPPIQPLPTVRTDEWHFPEEPKELSRTRSLISDVAAGQLGSSGSAEVFRVPPVPEAPATPPTQVVPEEFFETNVASDSPRVGASKLEPTTPRVRRHEESPRRDEVPSVEDGTHVQERCESGVDSLRMGESIEGRASDPAIQRQAVGPFDAPDHASASAISPVSNRVAEVATRSASYHGQSAVPDFTGKAAIASYADEWLANRRPSTTSGKASSLIGSTEPSEAAFTFATEPSHSHSTGVQSVATTDQVHTRHGRGNGGRSVTEFDLTRSPARQVVPITPLASSASPNLSGTFERLVDQRFDRSEAEGFADFSSQSELEGFFGGKDYPLSRSKAAAQSNLRSTADRTIPSAGAGRLAGAALEDRGGAGAVKPFLPVGPGATTAANRSPAAASRGPLPLTIPASAAPISEQAKSGTSSRQKGQSDSNEASTSLPASSEASAMPRARASSPSRAVSSAGPVLDHSNASRFAIRSGVSFEASPTAESQSLPSERRSTADGRIEPAPGQLRSPAHHLDKEEAPIRVSIGSIRIEATTPPVTPRRKFSRPSPRLSLDDYRDQVRNRR